MKAINIEWDVDYPEDLEVLPKEIEIPDNLVDYECEDTDEYMEAVSDYISSVTGFCRFGFYLIDRRN